MREGGREGRGREREGGRAGGRDGVREGMGGRMEGGRGIGRRGRYGGR